MESEYAFQIKKHSKSLQKAVGNFVILCRLKYVKPFMNVKLLKWQLLDLRCYDTIAQISLLIFFSVEISL